MALARVGELRERATLLHRTLADDGMGGATQTLTTYATVWAKIEAQSGGERGEAMRTEAFRQYSVVIRYRSDIADTDVIRWRGRDMNIRSKRDDGPRPLYMELECEMGARL